MTKYYLLEQDKRIADIAGIGDVPDDIEPLDWISGKRLPRPRDPLRLTLAGASGEEMTDIIGGLVTVFSNDLKDLLARCGIDNIDYFPVDLEHAVTRKVHAGYWLVNVIGRVACVDPQRSTIVPRPGGSKGILESFEIDAAKAGLLRLFRLDEKPTLIVIDAALRAQLLDAPLNGVRLRSTASYDGF